MKSTIAKEKRKFLKSKGDNLENLLFYYIEYPCEFTRTEAEILDGIFPDVEAQKQALLAYYKGRVEATRELIKNL